MPLVLMLATLTDRRDFGEDWLLERKFDGERCVAWEGLIAKRAQAPYVQVRSRDWLKLKCVSEQEFVIGGYTDPAGSRTDFGALLVGYYQDASLEYAGKVGTGYTPATLRQLRFLGLRDDKRPGEVVRERAR